MNAIVPDRLPDRPPVRHYLHVYADGHPVILDRFLREHFRAVDQSKVTYDAGFVFGIVGDPTNRAIVREYLPEGEVHEWGTGFEQRTLALMHRDVMSGRLDGGYVMYAHSKGVAHPSQVSEQWRHCMTKHVVRRAGAAITMLGMGADTVGAHWLTKADDPARVEVPFYGGNYWWSTVEHLRRLAPVGTTVRHEAEAWLGSVPPENPANMAPGWPGSECPNH
jgi:hypothetical protein